MHLTEILVGQLQLCICFVSTFSVGDRILTTRIKSTTLHFAPTVYLCVSYVARSNCLFQLVANRCALCWVYTKAIYIILRDVVLQSLPLRWLVRNIYAVCRNWRRNGHFMALQYITLCCPILEIVKMYNCQNQIAKRLI